MTQQTRITESYYQREAHPIISGTGSAMTHQDARSDWQKLFVAFAMICVVAVSTSAFLDRSHTATIPVTEVRVDDEYYRPASLKGIELLGKSKDDACAGDYRKRTLKLAYELPFAALFKDTKSQKKFEASDVIIVDDTVYSVCDSSWAISRFADTLQAFGPENLQIGDPTREGDVSIVVSLSVCVNHSKTLLTQAFCPHCNSTPGFWIRSDRS
jgi:hypothetical protein